MNKKKHIDRLFQDKLQNFEATPSDAVWENINAKLSLEKEKDRKVIPIWWKVAGIAAGLLLLITASNALFFNNDTSGIPENEVVNTEKDIDSNSTQEEGSTEENKVINTNNLINEDTIALDDEKDSGRDNSEGVTTNNQDSKLNTLVNTSNNRSNSNVASTSQDSNTELYKKGTVNQKDYLQNKNNSTQNLEKNAITENRSQEIKDRVKESNQDNTLQIDKNKVKELTKSAKNTITENAVTDINTTTKKDVEPYNEETEGQEENKLSVQEELDKVNEEKDVIDEEELNKKRWSVAPNIAPVYFNSLGSGSSIDSKFDNSPKSGQINMSYGVAANYQVNDKLSIRAGVNQVKLGYNTNNVIVYNNVETEDNGKPLKNVALNSESQNLSFLGSDGLSFGQIPDVVANNISSSIEQRLGFIEVPVEAEYKLSDKKLGLSLIGGFSTLFLNENQVYSTLQNERQLLGEATNINKTSFSANLGVGIKYKVSEKINLNLEPVFKYQLNTFSDTSGNFNPYTIGVYTGLSFKF